MSKHSLWFPRLSSWMSAVLLLLLTGVLSSSFVQITSIAVFLMLIESPRLFFLASILAVISPIIVVAYLHHLIQLILNRLDPDGAPDQKLRGWHAFFPVAMSWWEGMYAWFVILLGTLLTFGVLGMMMPWSSLDRVWEILDELYEMLLDTNKFKYLLNPGTFIWIMVTAYLYQFEHVIMLRGRKA